VRFHIRKTWRPGPLRITLTERGVRWGLHAGRWSWNPRTRRHTFDTPGLGHVTWSSWTPVLGCLLVLVLLGVVVCVVAVGWPL